MVTFVIFWAALFALLFFIVGTFCKMLSSALNALLNAAGVVLAIAGLTAMAVIAASLLCSAIDAIVGGGIGQLIWTIFLGALEVVIFYALFGGLGSLILAAVVKVATWILNIVSGILNKVTEICERGYVKCLTAIVRRTDRC